MVIYYLKLINFHLKAGLIALLRLAKIRLQNVKIPTSLGILLQLVDHKLFPTGRSLVTVA